MEEQKTCNRLNGYLDLTAPDGRVTPCCLLDIKDGWKSNIYDGVNFDDWNGNLRKGCWPCTDNEKNGHESMRQTSIKNGMQISLSFTCNFMCRICKPSLSTRWEKMIEGENFEKFDKDHYYTDPRRKQFVETYGDKNLERWVDNMDLVFDGVTLTKAPQSLSKRQKHAAQASKAMWMKKGEAMSPEVHTYNRYSQFPQNSL